MKVIKLGWAYCIIVLYALILLQSCGPGDPGVYKNDKINSGKLSDFHQLNNQLFEAIKAKKIYDVENLLSKELLEENSYRQTTESININSKLGGYDTLDEYYIVNYSTSDKYDLDATATDGTKYKFHCKALAEEMYIAFLTPKSKGDKHMVTLVYCKYKYGWKLNTIGFAPYTIMGKTAPKLYQYALNRYSKGYLVDAYNYMQLVNKTIAPSFYWQYTQGKAVGDFNSILGGELDKAYKFPLTIAGVPTQPKIFNLAIQTADDGVYPQIYYLSKIDLKNVDAIKAEVEQVKKTIGKVLPGIDQDKKHLYFSVFNNMPTGKKFFPSYEAVVDLP